MALYIQLHIIQPENEQNSAIRSGMDGPEGMLSE